MRTRSILAPAALSIAALVLAGCAGGTADDAGDGETYELLYSSHLPEASFTNTAMNWWIDEVTERSDGRITVESYYSGALCTFAEALACLNDGRADLSSVAVFNHPSELPTATVVGIPFQSSNAGAVSAAIRDLYEANEGFQQEWADAGAIPIVFQPTEGVVLGSNFPVGSLDDLEGHSTRATGYLTQSAAAIGMTPVQMDFTEIYEALDRGAIDTWMTSLDGAVSGSLYEVTDHLIDPGSGIYTAQGNPAISKATYDSLPEDLQQIIDEVSAENEENFSEDFFRPGITELCEETMPEVESFTALPESQVEEWQEALGDTADVLWIENATAAGVADPEKVLADFRAFIEEEEPNYEPVLQVEVCNSL